MKIEQLLVQHFYHARQVSLQGIGTFTLSPNFVLPPDNDKEIVFPENSISFQNNSRTPEDADLINYIVQQTRKMKPLASADLESFTMLATQFLNIGKPLKIEGIGMIEKTQSGEYHFTQGRFINTKVEDAEVKLKEKSREDVSFGNENDTPKSKNGKTIGIVLASLVALGLIGAAVWYFFMQDKNSNLTNKTTVTQTTPTPLLDTSKKEAVKIANPKMDSMIKSTKVDSSAMGAKTETGAYTFRVVIKNYNSLAEAQKRYNKLTSYGYKLMLYTADSITYKVAMPFNFPLYDTLRVKDSVRKALFGGSPYVELK